MINNLLFILGLILFTITLKFIYSYFKYLLSFKKDIKHYELYLRNIKTGKKIN